MKQLVVVNPGARLVDDEALTALDAAVNRLGGFDMQVTRQQGEAIQIVREAVERGVDTIIAAGGDGTLNEVVNGMSVDFSKSTLGVLPLGTGNDFGRSIDVPDGIDAALDAILSGQIRKIDVVQIISGNLDRYFINMSAGGFTGQVDENLTQEMKQTWGPLAYLRSGFETLPDLKEYNTLISFDDEDYQLIQAFNIVAANARYIGGGIPMAPEAFLDDGLLDVLIVPAAGMAQLMILVPQIILGQHMNNDLLMFRRARKVSIRSTPGMWFNIDGELLGKEPITFEVVPRALRVLTGPSPRGFVD